MEIRRTLWLPLDDLLVVREFLNPAVSRAGLSRCLKRHGLNWRPVEEGRAGRSEDLQERCAGLRARPLTPVFCNTLLLGRSGSFASGAIRASASCRAAAVLAA